MSYIKNTFINFKDLLIRSISVIKVIIKQFSITNLKYFFTIELKNIKAKLHNLNGTNWNLAQYHLVAGNYNDAIMRFKILQKRHYKEIECQYFLGRIYLEKNNFIKAKIYLNQYLSSDDNHYQIEAQYCLAIMNHSEVSFIPYRIICDKRDRIAFNLDKTNIDISLINRYYAIIGCLKPEITTNAKIFEIGCYIGILGRMIKEIFANSIDCYNGSEIGYEAGAVAQEIYLNNKYVYDEIYLCNDISQLISDQDSYSIVLIPDILAYYSDLSNIFMNTYKALKINGTVIIVTRIIKKDLNIEQGKNIEFLHPIEEFIYSYDYIIQLAKSCGLQLKNSNDIGDGFELFIFKKI